VNTKLVVIRYGEIGLKGKNRSFFERILKKQIQRVLKPDEEVHHDFGRLYVYTQEPLDAAARLKEVFGVVTLSPGASVELDMREIEEAAATVLASALAENPSIRSFKVEARRSNKAFPHTSPEISHRLGAFLLGRFPSMRVDVHDPHITVGVEVRQRALVFGQVIPGPGGLPVGSAGRAGLLLSGGIDSPVAGYLAMKRGVMLDCIHFHTFPYTSERSVDKVRRLCSELSKWGDLNLHLFSLTEVVEAIKQSCPEKLTITIMRRFMLRIAEAFCRQGRRLALVTGESLGQVASQTLESLYCIEHAVSVPVLRPLIGFDKTEIVALARRMGTYEVSVQPFDDCCSLFVPRNPSTQPRLEQVICAENALDVQGLVDAALGTRESWSYHRRGQGVESTRWQ